MDQITDTDQAKRNWDLLRSILEQDIARYEAKSAYASDYWGMKAYDLTGVLDTMNVFEHGLEFAQSVIAARYASVEAIAEASR